MSIKTRKFADDEFVRVRDNMKDYTEEIRKKIIDNKVDDLHIDMISLNEYVKRNVRIQKFIADIAEISHAEIGEINPDSYIVQLKFLGKETLGDLQQMLEVNREFALKFVAEKHRGKLRIGGDEYITHPMSVAEIVRQCGAAVSVRTCGNMET